MDYDWCYGYCGVEFYVDMQDFKFDQDEVIDEVF